MAIPVIDLNQFPASKEYKKLREASEEWGCFMLVNHKIPLTLLSEMKMVVRSLLDLPMEIKNKNTDVGSLPGSGYMAPSEINPHYETLGLYDFGSSQAVQNFCSQLNASSYQREVIEKYAAAIYELIADLGHKLAESLLGMGSDFLKGWICWFRINKYNFTAESIGSTGVQLHTDSGFMTILQADENVGGLEVMDKSGAFVAVDPSPGTLLVNLGDLAKVWSNGRLCAVKHRVQCREATIRISIASFLLGPKEEAVEALPEFVDSDHPPLYAPVTYEELRNLRFSTGLQDGAALEFFRIK